MTSTNSQTTPEAEAVVRDILHASGSSLDFFSMHKTRQSMFEAAQKHINAAIDRGEEIANAKREI